MGTCRLLFSIIDTTYKELTLEFLETFELEPRMISFHKGRYSPFRGVLSYALDGPNKVLSLSGTL